MSSDSTTQLQLLLDRLNAGDEAARGELIERACQRLRRLTRKIFQDFRRLRPLEDSADVLQNVLMRLARRLQNLTGKSGQGAPRTVRDFFRLASVEICHAFLDLIGQYFGPGRPRPEPLRTPQDSSDAAGIEPSDHAHDPGPLQLWTEFHQQVAALPDEEREVFELRWYQGLSSEETAEVLGTSLATVKRRWLKARLLFQPLVDEGLFAE